MKKLLVVLMVVGLVGMMAGMGEAATTDDVKINLYIAPIVNTSLTVSPTFYDFGSVALGISTVSISSLTLTNNGDIDIEIEKEVIADGDWNIMYSSTAKDGFILWAMVADTKPNNTEFVTGVSSFSNVGLNELNNLTNKAGALVSMSKDNTKNIWFRLDMPYSVSVSGEQKLQIRLMATSD